jgi:hypothetical protein
MNRSQNAPKRDEYPRMVNADVSQRVLCATTPKPVWELGVAF